MPSVTSLLHRLAGATGSLATLLLPRRPPQSSAGFFFSAGRSANSLYDGHVPTTGWEKALLSVGAGVAAIANPQRADMVATLCETTGRPSLETVRERLLATAPGRRLLRERPVVTSACAERARRCAPGTLGHAYARYLDAHGFDPDARPRVSYIDDEELAYIALRCRQIHDFWHALTGLPPTERGELTLKVLECRMTGTPMTALAASIGATRLVVNALDEPTASAPRLLRTQQLRQWLREDVPWALKVGGTRIFWLDFPYEKMLDAPLADVRASLMIDSLAPEAQRHLSWVVPDSSLSSAQRSPA